MRYAYGLAAAGEAGVTRALEILRADVDRTLKLLGCHIHRRTGPVVCGCAGELAVSGSIAFVHFVSLRWFKPFKA